MLINFEKTIVNKLKKKGKQEKSEKLYKQFVLHLKNSGLNPSIFLQKLFETIPVKVVIKKVNKKEEQVRLMPTHKQIKLACAKLIKDQNTLKNPKELANLESNTIKALLNEKKDLYREGARLV